MLLSAISLTLTLCSVRQVYSYKDKKKGKGTLERNHRTLWLLLWKRCKVLHESQEREDLDGGREFLGQGEGKGHAHLGLFGCLR